MIRYIAFAVDEAGTVYAGLLRFDMSLLPRFVPEGPCA